MSEPQKLFRVLIDARVRGVNAEDALSHLGDHLIAANKTFSYSGVILLVPSTIEAEEIPEEGL
jgi:hypothetical protein